MRADGHIFIFQNRIAAFPHGDDILSCRMLSLDRDCNRDILAASEIERRNVLSVGQSDHVNLFAFEQALAIFSDINTVGTGGALGCTVNFSTTERAGCIARSRSCSQVSNALASGIISTPFAPCCWAYTAGLLQSSPIRPARSVRATPRGKPWPTTTMTLSFTSTPLYESRFFDLITQPLPANTNGPVSAAVTELGRKSSPTVKSLPLICAVVLLGSSASRRKAIF